MQYMKPSKRYKYFSATSSGNMPTKARDDQDLAIRDLEFCRKGWPDRMWTIYRIEFKKREKGEVDIVSVEKKEGNFWQKTITPLLFIEEINKKHSKKIKV